MPDEIQLWEYRVQTFGGTFKGMGDEDLSTQLNEWGEEGWEVINAHSVEGSYKTKVIAKRPLTDRARRRRSMP